MLSQKLQLLITRRRLRKIMHDIWNPWHGCKKISEGCQNCYMYFLDSIREQDGSNIYKVKNNFDYPLKKNKNGTYKVKSGEQIRVCMTSDFFLEEADKWRDEAWEIMKKRSDVIFFLLTKRPERVAKCLPKDWQEGWENIFFNVTCENQKRADERIPILFDLPFKHKGIMVAPFIGEVHIAPYLKKNIIEQVIVGGENYEGSRPLQYEWVKSLYDECVQNNVTFNFFETGTRFIKDGKMYHLPNKELQSQMAYKSGLNYVGKKMEFKLDIDSEQTGLFQQEIYEKKWKEKCHTCGSQMICNGCSNCGRCGG